MRFGCDILIRNIVMGVGVPPGRVFRSAVNYVTVTVAPQKSETPLLTAFLRYTSAHLNQK
jgi:hypothetical protein